MQLWVVIYIYIYFCLKSLKFTVFYLLFKVKLSRLITQWVILKQCFLQQFEKPKEQVSCPWNVQSFFSPRSVRPFMAVAQGTTEEWISWNGNFGFQEITLCQTIHYSETTCGLFLLFPNPMEWSELQAYTTRGNSE